MQGEGYTVEAAPRRVISKPVLVKTEAETTLENRLANWRDTVRGAGRGGAGSCSSAWAAAYVQARDDRERQIAIAMKLIRPESALYGIDVNELDGWLIEAAVSSMVHFDQKQVLRFKYVWGYPNHFIKSKLHINDTSLRIVLGRALTNLQNIIDKLDSPAKIRLTIRTPV